MAALCLVLLALLLGGAASAEGVGDRSFRECPDCPEMVGIPGGSFAMGSPASERGRFDDEGPVHPVQIRAFALARTEVTTDSFLKFLRETGYQPAPCNPVLGLGWGSPGKGMAYTPGATEPLDWPAVCLSWDDATAYIAWLNGKVRVLPSVKGTRDGPYRLPSEAEWEYAARAGTTTARWWGEAIGKGEANCDGCGSKWDRSLLAPVGSFGPNPFGLWDMLGNSWAWVADCWNESYVGAPRDGSAWTRGDCSRRVLRGGSWINVPTFVRSAARSRANQDGTDFDNSAFAGIRVARELP